MVSSGLYCLPSIKVTDFLTDVEQALSLTRPAIDDLTPHFSPSSHPLLSLVQTQQTLLISSSSMLSPTESEKWQALEEAALLGSRALTGMGVGNAQSEGVYPKGHPARGIALATLGKLLLVDAPPTSLIESRLPAPSSPARLHWVAQTLILAWEELKTGFGREKDGGKAGRNVRDMLTGVEREVAMLRS